MKTELTDLMFYGAWDDENDDFPEDAVWFEKSSGQYFQTDALTEDFGYKDCEEIERSGFFIPLFRRSETELMKEFVRVHSGKEAENEIRRIVEEKDKNYGVAFRIYAEVHPDFEQAYASFEKRVLAADAKAWAEKNGVAFFGDYDPDRKIVFSTLCMFFYYEENEENDIPGYTRHWISKKDFAVADQAKIDCMLACGKLTQETLEKDWLLIPAVTEDEAKQAGKDWDAYVEEIAKQWCDENGVRWHIPSRIPDHIKK